jgi:hypothetical protein
MAAVTGCTMKGIVPNLGRKMLLIVTPATADSNDSVDVSSATVTGGETLASIDFVTCWDQTTGDIVTATVASTTVITIDASGGTTNHVYSLLVIGQA